MTFNQLFGTTYQDTPLFWTFKTIEFDRVGLSNYIVETPSVLVALHEMFLRSFIGNWVDNNGNTIGDDVSDIIYTYVQQYDTVKAIPLNKRIVDANTVWSYLWQLPEQTTPLSDVDVDTDSKLIFINGDTVNIRKATLNDAATVDELLYKFAAYLSQGQVSGVDIREGVIIEITTTENDPLDIDDVI